MALKKHQLLELLRKDRLKELFEGIQDYLEANKRQDLLDQFYILEGRYHQWQRHKDLGTRNTSELSAEANQLRESLVNFIQNLYQPAPAKHSSFAKKKWFWPVIIGVTCVLLIGLGSMKTPSIQFELEAETRFVAFRLEQDWDLNTNLLVDHFEVFPVKHAHFDTVSFTKEVHGPLELQIEGGRTQLVSMPLKKQTALSFTLDYDEIIGRLYDADMEAKFYLNNSTLSFPDIEFEQVLGDSSKMIQFSVSTEKAAEFSLIPVVDSTFLIYNKLISGLDFQREANKLDQPMVSGIKSGTISTQKIPHQLEKEGFIEIINPQSTTLTLTKKDHSLSVKVKGKAKDLKIGGTHSTLTSIKSTYIEHIAKNERANLYWNALVLLLGTAWGAFQVLKREK